MIVKKMARRFGRLWNGMRGLSRNHAARNGNSVRISPGARVSFEHGRALFLNVHSGVLFTSNLIGSRIWQHLEEGESVESIAARLVHENGAPADRALKDALEFIGELEARGFLIRETGC
jgi:hypothetical protein